jgi:isopentenyldiphosphate isomerase
VRADLRERGLIGRCTFIMLFNSAGELCVHRRTLSKALYPGYWDVAAGGMVRPMKAMPSRRPASWKKSWA